MIDDVSGATSCFNPLAAGLFDAYLLDNARRRRKGEMVV